jgi:Tol biopolymer transport system component
MKDPTQLVVRVDSNFDIPAELDTVRATVRDGAGNITTTRDFPLGSPANIPFSFGVAHRGGDLAVAVEIEARKGDQGIFTRRSKTNFVEDKTLLLPVYLAEHCLSVTCEANYSCTQNGCESDEVANLREIDPGDEVNLDRDAGIPAEIPDGGDPNKGGIIVAPLTGLRTRENGTRTATFTVTLDREPLSYVAIELSTSDPNEGVVDVSMLTFTPLDWNIPKEVIVRGLDDTFHDGDKTFFIRTAPAVSGESLYRDVDAADVEVTNEDDDVVSIELIGSTGLSTTERGTSATFQARLTSEPTADVVLSISSSDESEGRVLTPERTITPEEWTDTFEITVEGVDDDEPDRAQIYQVRIDPSASADADYQMLPVIEVAVTNADNETPGITVTPSSGLLTGEDGAAATFTVVLNTRPSSAVRIEFESDNLAEGTVNPRELDFDTNNWEAEQVVEITGVDDEIADGDVAFTVVSPVATSNDADYGGMEVADVGVLNRDDDLPGITVEPLAGLVTTEAGGTAFFEVRLNSEPAADVQIAVMSSDETEASIGSASLTFTAANWSRPQRVTLTGANDEIEDGAVAYFVVLGPVSSTDPKYSALNPVDVMATNADDDAAGVTVAPILLETAEAVRLPASFVVFLNTEPTSNVTIGLTSSDVSEGTVSPAMLTFTTANWDMPQTVLVTGVNDAVDDGDVQYQIVTGAAVSSDPEYSNLAVVDISALNIDDDTAQILVMPTSGLQTGETSGTATFSLRLSSEPTADVTLPLSSSDTSEGTVSAPQHVFNSMNWSMPVTITIRGVDDMIDDGDVAYTIVTAAASSADNSYNDLNPPNVAVTNTDDDQAGITVLGGLVDETRETGSQATYSLFLNSQPTANVTLTFNVTPAEATISGPIVFTPADWNMAHDLVITGADDNVLDGDVEYIVAGQPVMSTDAVYAAMAPPDFVLQSIDDGALPPTLIASVSGAVPGLRTDSPAISEDGRILTFVSREGLEASDLNNFSDIYLFERASQTTTRVSSAPVAAVEPDGESIDPAISADGRYVVYSTAATNFDLSISDTNGVPDIIFYDRVANLYRLMSYNSSGVGDQASSQPNISATGDYVVFASQYQFSGMDVGACVFVREVSGGAPAIQAAGFAAGDCFQPSISSDGQWVVFATGARSESAVFLYDLQNSVQTELAPTYGPRHSPGISPDGNYIWFSSTNNQAITQVHRLHRPSGAIEVVSTNMANMPADADADHADLSDNGNFVAFLSSAGNLGSPSSTNALYLRDHLASTISQRAPQSDADPSISGNGRFVVYVGPSAGTGIDLYLVSR